MRVKWLVGPGVRADLVAYAGHNLNGKRQQVQLFPSGARRGELDGAQVSSLVIRALPGTRVTVRASDGDDWEQAAWRCVRVLAGHSLPSERKNGLPGVRIPDLDMLDAFGAKKHETDFESSYPYVASLDDGKGWTFGRGGGLRNRVALIAIDREGEDGRVLSPGESVAQAVLEALASSHPDAVSTALEAAVAVLSQSLDGVDASERIRALEERWE